MNDYITYDSLIKHKFIRESLSLPNGNEFITYSKDFDNCHLTINETSNTIGRDWHVHIDNCDFQSVGSCDVQTFDHINKFLKILDFDYEV